MAKLGYTSGQDRQGGAIEAAGGPGSGRRGGSLACASECTGTDCADSWVPCDRIASTASRCLHPTRVLLAISLKTAKAVNIAVPPLLLSLADEVIE